MLLKEELYNDILAAVITGNASPQQQASFNNLLQTDTSFQQLYEQLKTAYHQPAQTLFFDADKAFEKVKKRLGK